MRRWGGVSCHFGSPGFKQTARSSSEFPSADTASRRSKALRGGGDQTPPTSRHTILHVDAAQILDVQITKFAAFVGFWSHSAQTPLLPRASRWSRSQWLQPLSCETEAAEWPTGESRRRPAALKVEIRFIHPSVFNIGFFLSSGIIQRTKKKENVSHTEAEHRFLCVCKWKCLGS